MIVFQNPPPRPQNQRDQLEDFHEELTDDANHPKIGKAIFKRVTSQFLGSNDYPRLRIAPHPVFDMNARNLSNQHFSLARWSGQGRFLTGYTPCPSAEWCRRTEHPLQSSDQPVKKTKLRI
ncbi:hypothetical protein AVEN_164230-1 [Araneus ventricosus]|uniref:Uncharacterized protein n=1 Tax=Araneus ventricosus TaxID=182803 RepID=A0A4Y2IE94_ARAVE|nr:hypothetical protein AVEN_164230-1 [Araneus ventricosus]